MQDFFLNIFSGSPLFNLISFIIALLGIILTVYYYPKSKKEKKPVYDIYTFGVIFPQISSLENLEIKYKDSLIKRLSVTKISFWNAGKETIRKGDLNPSNPVRIRINEGLTIYDIKVLFEKKDNSFYLKHIDNNEITIEFDYLDYNDGLVLAVYHNGSKNSDLKILGKIIGASKIDLGIEKDQILNKAEFLLTPINVWSHSKNFFMKILGIILALPTIAIMLPIAIILFPINFINNLSYKK